MNVKRALILLRMLMKPPILRMPDTKGLFRLMSDTSIVATGTALYQC